MTKAEVNIHWDDRVNYASFDSCEDYIYTAITNKVRNSGKRPGVNSIFSYVVKDVRSNMDKDLLGKIMTLFIGRKELENRLTAVGNSYFVIDECFNQELGDLLKEKETFLPRCKIPYVTNKISINITKYYLLYVKIIHSIAIAIVLEYSFHHFLLPREIHFQMKFSKADLPFIPPNIVISWVRSVSINTCNW